SRRGWPARRRRPGSSGSCRDQLRATHDHADDRAAAWGRLELERPARRAHSLRRDRETEAEPVRLLRAGAVEALQHELLLLGRDTWAGITYLERDHVARHAVRLEQDAALSRVFRGVGADAGQRLGEQGLVRDGGEVA